MSTFCVEWLRTQEHWNPEVAIIFGVTACYHRATVGSSHDDAHPDNSTLHTGVGFPPHRLCGVSLISYIAQFGPWQFGRF
jgi:hypothetical protein